MDNRDATATEPATAMLQLPAIAIGAAAAGALVGVLHRLGRGRALRFLAAALLVAAAIYLGLALAGGASAGWVAAEAGGVLLFGALAAGGLRYALWLLAGGWFAHIAWDVVLHGQAIAFVPSWYPALCVGFDLVVSAYVVLAGPGWGRGGAGQRVAGG